jgi:2'-5' RNA ligase
MIGIEPPLSSEPRLRAASQTLHTLFFAALPDQATVSRINDLSRRLKVDLGLSAALRPAATLHASLWLTAKKMREAPPPGVVALASRIAGQVAVRSFAVSLNRVEAWSRPDAKGPVVLVGDEGAIGLQHLHEEIARAHGRRPDPGFVPHVSLAWGECAAFSRHIEPIRWTVRDFVLVHSFHGESRYEILARFPLTGGDA